MCEIVTFTELLKNGTVNDQMRTEVHLYFIRIFQRYEFSIAENRVYPTQVATVFATDRDSGSYATIKYSITGQNSQDFTILPQVCNRISTATGLSASNHIFIPLKQPKGQNFDHMYDEKHASM